MRIFTISVSFGLVIVKIFNPAFKAVTAIKI